jgi:hypothetical protein
LYLTQRWSWNTDGVKLGEGIVIADEDTTIYNPGLSLLTSSEKQRLVSAIVDNRAAGLTASPPGSGWSEENEYAFGYLKQKLDPLHMHELGGYLGILPYYGAVLYLAALAVQKNARELFPLAYGLCALGVFGPALVLVAFGPWFSCFRWGDGCCACARGGGGGALERERDVG